MTNGQEHISFFTVEKPDADGVHAWSLSDAKTVADVTRGPCCSARYTPKGASVTCSPADADRGVFPLKIGQASPAVDGCNRKQYAVLIVFGLPMANS